MNYIELLNTGKILICHYKDFQTDDCGDIWNHEIWYKSNEKYICEYLNLEFTTTHDLSEIEIIWANIENMIKCDEITIDIINDVAKYCCKEMQNNGWYIERKDNQINLQEEYSAHFVENIKICPWCGKKL